MATVFVLLSFVFGSACKVVVRDALGGYEFWVRKENMNILRGPAYNATGALAPQSLSPQDSAVVPSETLVLAQRSCQKLHMRLGIVSV